MPLAVQRRFARDLAPGESRVYLGEVASTERTIVGWMWVQMLRIVGAPLPTGMLAHTPSTVVVTASSAHAQCWTRIYHGASRLPQVIRSMKRFAGPTGLEERISGGIAMALAVTVESHALVFRSAGYHWRCNRIRLPLPAWLTPGCVEVRHREEQEGHFSFVLTVVHPWWGRIFRQVAYFKDGN
ncbi:MAG: DUF4166 domain-containing protein [Pseudomonadota bacterium]